MRRAAMDSFLKHHFWILNLVALAVIAWLAARVANNMLAEQIAGMRTTPVTTKDSGKQKAKVRLAGEDDPFYRAVTGRNLFNAHPPEEVDEDDEPNEEVADLGGMPGPKDDCKKSDLKASLQMTFVAEPASRSIAVIAETATNKQRMLVEGQAYEEHTVVSIQRARVILVKNGNYTCFEQDPLAGLISSRPGSKGKGSSQSTEHKEPTRSSYQISEESYDKPVVASDMGDSVKKVGQNNYEIDRGRLDSELQDMDNLARQARSIIHYANGKPQGVKVVGIRPGSLYSSLGVTSGDLIKSVNGESIETADQTLSLFESLKNNDTVTVDIERRGRKVTLEYSVK